MLDLDLNRFRVGWKPQRRLKGLWVLVLLALAGAGVGNGAWGQGCGPWANVEVDPPDPTSAVSISLILSGVWCDDCVPESPTVSIVGTRITVSTTNKRLMCLPVTTPWELRVPIGRLSPGRYDVLVLYKGAPIGGLEVLEVREAKPDFLIEAIRWTPASPAVGDCCVSFDVMVVNAGRARAYLHGVVLEVYVVKGGQPISVGKKAWSSGHLDPGQMVVASVTTDPYSPLTWEGGTFLVEACMDATDVVRESAETNNSIVRAIVIQGAATPLLGPLRLLAALLAPGRSGSL